MKSNEKILNINQYIIEIFSENEKRRKQLREVSRNEARNRKCENTMPAVKAQ